MLVEVVLDDVAHREPNGSAEVAHAVVLESDVKRVFDAPKQRGGENAHKSVEHEGLAVVHQAFRLALKTCGR